MKYITRPFTLLLLVVLLMFSCQQKEAKTSKPVSDNVESIGGDKVSNFVSLLGDSIIYDWAERSFSPFYSDIGLVFIDYPGIPGAYFHFNRKSIALKNICKIDDEVLTMKSTALGVEQELSKSKAKFAFYKHDAFLAEINGDVQVTVSFKPKKQIPVVGLGDYRFKYEPWYIKRGDVFLFRGYMPNQDKRDPDPFYPVMMGVRVLKGEVKESNKEGLAITAEKGEIKLAYEFQLLDIDENELTQSLNHSATTFATCLEETKQWYARALGDLPIYSGSLEEQKLAAKAAQTLVFNATKSEGFLKDRIASFPNRGNYPTQFEWDAAFQNLAYEMMDPQLAEDALLILTESMRVDGKIGQYVNATSLRPIEIQVPLVGWAAKRLYEQRKDTAFARQMLDALVKNNNWILDNRMTKYGLVTTLTPWELWDDTPRLDSGAILACDFNADLLMQIQACAYLANELGESEIAASCQAQADTLAQKMMDVLYDKEANIFRDVLVETGEKLSIITPANFVPLLADMPVSKEKAKGMIRTYLLDTTKLFGYVPFPSVAYDEPTYIPALPNKPHGLTWRGPTWMPMAWMMLEVLRKNGFESEREFAARRIYNLLIEDGELHELFNSQTGEGIGVPQLGWTAAIYLKLKSELQQ